MASLDTSLSESTVQHGEGQARSCDSAAVFGDGECGGKSSCANAATQTELTIVGAASEETTSNSEVATSGASFEERTQPTASSMPNSVTVLTLASNPLSVSRQDTDASSSSKFDLEAGLNTRLADGSDDENEKVCRVCQLSLHQSNDAMELGCACKDDLARVHRHCAEAWFKIRGNRTCEICGKAVKNLPELNEQSVIGHRQSATRPAVASVDADLRWWQQQPVRNFLLACAVIAFMLPWLFRFFS